MLICIIQARQSSTRLPGKAMMKLRGKPAIERVVNRVKAVNIIKPLIDKIVVATTTDLCDNPIEKWCKTNKVECYRGSRDDVLGRFYHCALKYNADYILRITADCPFLSPVLVAGLLMVKPREPYSALAVNRGGIIDGNDAELFSIEELERVYKKAKSCYDTEHVSPMMRKADEDWQDYGTPFDFRGLKLSLDTPEDLERLRKYSELIC